MSAFDRPIGLLIMTACVTNNSTCSRDALAPGLAFHPFVTIQDHLRTKWRIAAHPDRHMAPLPINHMKEEMPDERPSFAMTDFGDPAFAIAFDFPERGPERCS